MEISRALRLREAAQCEHGPIGPDHRVVAAGRRTAAPGPGLRHQQESGQCRRPQPGAPPPARGSTPVPGAAGRHLPHSDEPRGRIVGLPGPMRPSRSGYRRSRSAPGPDARSARPAVTAGATRPGPGPNDLNEEPLPRTNPSHSIVSQFIRAIIIAYRVVSRNRMPVCRFVPSCSEYALEAVERFGARQGLPLLARRLLRCRPGGPFGWDPVPDGPLAAGTGSPPPVIVPPGVTGPGEHR